MLRVLIVTTLLAVATKAFVFKAQLPVYIQRCSRSDPNLNQCFIDNGNVAIQQLSRGDQRYGIPSMVPYELPEVVLRDDNELRLVMRNVQIFGLDRARLTGVNVDFEQGTLEQNLTIPQLNIVGDYELDGQILDEYVQGRGRATISIVSGLFTTHLEFKIENNKAVPTNTYTYYRPQIVIYDLQNLYDGNEFRAPYFDTCRQNDPQLAQCIIRAGNRVIPTLVKGDVHYNIPNMLPLRLKEVVIRNDRELRFVLRNIEVRGLGAARMTGAYLDLNNLIFRYNVTIPRLNIKGDYEMKGQLLNVPVNGLGKTNITMLNTLFDNGFRMTLDQDNFVTNYYPFGYYYNPQRVFYQFTNLQSGNDFQGYQTNVFLNNNWLDVSRSFHLGAAKAISDFATSIFSGLSQVLTFNEALPPY